jgi:hypothetical protein
MAILTLVAKVRYSPHSTVVYALIVRQAQRYPSTLQPQWSNSFVQTRGRDMAFCESYAFGMELLFSFVYK